MNASIVVAEITFLRMARHRFFYAVFLPLLVMIAIGSVASMPGAQIFTHLVFLLPFLLVWATCLSFFSSDCYHCSITHMLSRALSRQEFIFGTILGTIAFSATMLLLGIATLIMSNGEHAMLLQPGHYLLMTASLLIDLFLVALLAMAPGLFGQPRLIFFSPFLPIMLALPLQQLIHVQTTTTYSFIYFFDMPHVRDWSFVVARMGGWPHVALMAISSAVLFCSLMVLYQEKDLTA